MRGTDPRSPSSSSEVLKPFLMLAHTRQEHHCVFRTDFIGLQGLQNNFTCYFSHFLQQPCEAVDKYFHPCFVEGKLHSKKGRAGPQATVLYSHSGAGSAIRVSCPPSLTPLFCFTHQSQDLRILHSGSNQASSNNVASKVVLNFLNLIILMRINVTHPLIYPFGQMHLIFDIPWQIFRPEYLLLHKSTFTLQKSNEEGFPGGSVVKNPPAVHEMEMWDRSLGRKDPLEEGMATHSSILAWRILWTEAPVGPHSTGSQRVRQDWSGWAAAAAAEHRSSFVFFRCLKGQQLKL